MAMLKQYSAIVDKFGKAYALLNISQKEKMVGIEYYLIFDDSGNATIKGGILEVEALMENTLETYLNEHVNESLPYMVIRSLVDNHTPEELEGLSEIKFEDNDQTVETIKSSYAKFAALIAEKCTAETIKNAFK